MERLSHTAMRCLLRCAGPHFAQHTLRSAAPVDSQRQRERIFKVLSISDGQEHSVGSIYSALQRGAAAQSLRAPRQTQARQARL